MPSSSPFLRLGLACCFQRIFFVVDGWFSLSFNFAIVVENEEEGRRGGGGDCFTSDVLESSHKVQGRVESVSIGGVRVSQCHAICRPRSKAGNDVSLNRSGDAEYAFGGRAWDHGSTNIRDDAGVENVLLLVSFFLPRFSFSHEHLRTS